MAGAVAINSIVFNLARFVGPMLAGLIVWWAWTRPSSPMRSAMSCSWWRSRASASLTGGAGARRSSFRADLAEGIRYTATHPRIGALFALLIAIGIGGWPLTELLPGFAADHLQIRCHRPFNTRRRDRLRCDFRRRLARPSRECGWLDQRRDSAVRSAVSVCGCGRVATEQHVACEVPWWWSVSRVLQFDLRNCGPDAPFSSQS